MKKFCLKEKAIIGTAAIAAVSAVPAHAAPIDVSSVVATIVETAGPIGLIGGAVLVVYVTIKGYKWVRSSMS